MLGQDRRNPVRRTILVWRRWDVLRLARTMLFVSGLFGTGELERSLFTETSRARPPACKGRVFLPGAALLPSLLHFFPRRRHFPDGASFFHPFFFIRFSGSVLGNQACCLETRARIGRCCTGDTPFCSPSGWTTSIGLRAMEMTIPIASSVVTIEVPP